jgi:hypothetical protein
MAGARRVDARFLNRTDRAAIRIFTFPLIQASFVLSVERVIDRLSYARVLLNHEGFI